MATVKLLSGEGHLFEVDVQVAKTSGVIKAILEDPKTVANRIVIPLPSINTQLMDKVIQFATHHQDDPPATDEDGGTHPPWYIPQWDRDFLDVSIAELNAILNAACLLNMKGLMTMTCKTFANHITGKSPEEIRKMFHIQTLTSRQVEQLRLGG